MKILFDTNVVLDLLLDREPFSSVAAQLFSKVESESITGYLCATTVTTIHYLTTKVIGREAAKGHIKKLLTLFRIASVNRIVLESAMTSKFTDFEDAVLHESALQVDAQGLVTRNIADFKHAQIPVYLPQELSRILSVRENK